MNETPQQNGIHDRIEERRKNRREHHGGEWILGIVLIGLAVIMLLDNQKIYTLNNWWALFILIPALGSLGNAWRTAQSDGGRFNRQARSSLIVGLGFLLVTAMFLFSLSWTVMGPFLLALAGVGLLINGLLPD